MRIYIAAAVSAWALAAQGVDFNRDIRPILSDRCFACHGPDAATRKIQLRLDSEAAARAAIVPGDAAASLLVKRITHPTPAMRMPPPYSGQKLSEREIDLLTKWVASGARWRKHWSFEPPRRAEAPTVSNAAWVRNPIDAFVLARLDREGLTPAPEAARHTLIRRASLDLTGLPPTPAEVDAFVNDPDPGAYEKLLDHLLASPRYGERMAARWLDAARYADTNGYQTDAERHMWRWRDWVIDAFNRNQPFDRFLTEQLAGDLLPGATLDQKIATGFNRNHRGNSEGGIVPEEYLAEYAVDRVETMSTVFLGLTLGCARCHNHKYDPFTQKEFYQLFAYFNSIPELGRYLKFGNTPPTVAAPRPDEQRKLLALDRALEQAQGRLAKLEPEAAAAQRVWEQSLKADAAWALIEGQAAESAAPAHFDGKRFETLGDKAAYGFYDKFTLAARIRPDAPDGAIVTRAADDEDGEGYGLYLEKGKLQVNLIKRRLDDSIRVETKAAVPLNRWTHVAMSYDGSRVATGIRVYIDGRPQELTIILDAINQDFRVKEPLRVGGGAALRFRGEIADVRVYGRALAPEEAAVIADPRPLAELARKPESSRSSAERDKLRRAFFESAAPASLRSAWDAVRAARREREAFAESLPTVMVMEELPKPNPTFVLLRGAYDRPGDPVQRAVPAALHSLPPGAPADRLGLAQWLTDPANPLTARVTVNRFWQMYFGVGIVKTVEDFGSQGEWPSHPELLDWLATEFVRTGWDVKGLQKTILMSATYRQSSQAPPERVQRDPENRLLARGPRLRLPAETIRDQALFVSGLLVEKLGGPSVKPYQPAGLWSELGGADYQRDQGEGLYRRGMYTFWKRTAAPPYMATFDSAMRESCTVRETRTNTPLQALNLMNDVAFVEAARKLGERAMREGGAHAESRIAHLFRLALARAPRPAESARLAASLAKYLGHYGARPEDAAKLLAQGDAPRDPRFAPQEAAAWAMLASTVLNLDEAVTKE